MTLSIWPGPKRRPQGKKPWAWKIEVSYTDGNHFCPLALVVRWSEEEVRARPEQGRYSVVLKAKLDIDGDLRNLPVFTDYDDCLEWLEKVVRDYSQPLTIRVRGIPARQ